MNAKRYELRVENKLIGVLSLSVAEAERLHIVMSHSPSKIWLSLRPVDTQRATWTWGEDTTRNATQEKCERDIEQYLIDRLADGDIAPVRRSDGKEYQIEVMVRLVPIT